LDIDKDEQDKTDKQDFLFDSKLKGIAMIAKEQAVKIAESYLDTLYKDHFAKRSGSDDKFIITGIKEKEQRVYTAPSLEMTGDWLYSYSYFTNR
jgi:isocitrate dehydrogenase kinase/phosphatase